MSFHRSVTHFGPFDRCIITKFRSNRIYQGRTQEKTCFPPRDRPTDRPPRPDRPDPTERPPARPQARPGGLERRRRRRRRTNAGWPTASVAVGTPDWAAAPRPHDSQGSCHQPAGEVAGCARGDGRPLWTPPAALLRKMGALLLCQHATAAVVRCRSAPSPGKQWRHMAPL